MSLPLIEANYVITVNGSEITKTQLDCDIKISMNTLFEPDYFEFRIYNIDETTQKLFTKGATVTIDIGYDSGVNNKIITGIVTKTSNKDTQSEKVTVVNCMDKVIAQLKNTPIELSINTTKDVIDIIKQIALIAGVSIDPNIQLSGTLLPNYTINDSNAFESIKKLVERIGYLATAKSSYLYILPELSIDIVAIKIDDKAEYNFTKSIGQTQDGINSASGYDFFGIGMPTIVPLKLMEIDRQDQGVSGNFIIETVVHEFNAKKGYITKGTVLEITSEIDGRYAVQFPSDKTIGSVLNKKINDSVNRIQTSNTGSVEEVFSDKRMVTSHIGISDEDRKASVIPSVEADIDKSNTFLIEKPVASSFVGDGFGLVAPIYQMAHAAIIHNKLDFQDSNILGFLWKKKWTIPDHDDGDYMIHHKNHSKMVLKEDGDLILQFTSFYAQVGDDGLTTVKPSAGVAGNTMFEHDVVGDPHEFGIKRATLNMYGGRIENAVVEALEAMKEPTGFQFEKLSDSVLSYVNGTRTVSIAPAGSSYDYWRHGEKITVTTIKSIVIPDTDNIYGIYIDSNGDLQYLAGGYTFAAIENEVAVTVVYWDTVRAEFSIIEDERHGIQMDGMQHARDHYYIGTIREFGGTLNNIIADGSGDLATHAQFGVDSSAITDEDLRWVIASLTTPANLRIFYRTGAIGVWRYKTADDYPIIYGNSTVDNSGDTLCAWNEFTGGSWQLTEITNNNFALVHYFLINDVAGKRVIGICGQADYGNIAAAREGALTEIANLLLGGLPVAEIVANATVIYQTGNGYGNTPKARIRTTDLGDDYIYWEDAKFNASSAPTSHNNLSDRDTVNSHPSSAISVDVVNIEANKQEILQSFLEFMYKFMKLDADKDYGANPNVNNFDITLTDWTPFPNLSSVFEYVSEFDNHKHVLKTMAFDSIETSDYLVNSTDTYFSMNVQFEILNKIKILDVRTSGNTRLAGIYFTAAGIIQIWVDGIWVTIDLIPEIDKWYHLIMYFDDINCKYWINGMPIYEKTTTDTGTPYWLHIDDRANNDGKFSYWNTYYSGTSFKDAMSSISDATHITNTLITNNIIMNGGTFRIVDLIPCSYGAGATVGYVAGTPGRDGDYYLPPADNNCLCAWRVSLPDWVKGDETFILKVDYYLSGAGTFSGLWSVVSLKKGDAASAAPNVLNVSTAYNLDGTYPTISTKVIPLDNTNINHGDGMTVLFKSNASNARYVVIKRAWLVIN